jgi:hypothetical protein
MKSLLFILLLSLIFFGCKENPVNPPEEHFEVVGIVFYSGGVEIASIFQGNTNDTLTVAIGITGELITVKFFDEDMDIIEPPDEEDISFGWRIVDESILEIVQDDGREGEFEFRLKGVSPGNTFAEFVILHGNHEDFKSGNVPVRVN